MTCPSKGARKGPVGLTAAEDRWSAMVAHHAAKHVAAGESIERAIELGIADYTAQLNALITKRYIVTNTDEGFGHHVYDLPMAAIIARRLYEEIRT